MVSHQGFVVFRSSFLFPFLFFCLGFVHADELAPDFELRTLDGERSVKLSDYRGKVVYLDFWASWCGPCRQSLPAFERLQQEYADQDFKVLAVNLDAEASDAQSFLSQYPVSYTVLADASGSISRRYELVGLPSSVLLSKTGVIVASFQGFYPGHIERIRKAVDILLGKPQS